MPKIAKGREELTPLQITTLEALVTSKTMVQAAKKAGVSRESIRLWMKEPTFSAAYRELKSELFEGIAIRLYQLGQKAVDGYADVLEGPAMAGSYTLSKTSESILTQLFRIREGSERDELLATMVAEIAELKANAEL